MASLTRCGKVSVLHTAITRPESQYFLFVSFVIFCSSLLVSAAGHFRPAFANSRRVDNSPTPIDNRPFASFVFVTRHRHRQPQPPVRGQP
jgi:hypothetical protein